MGKGRWTFEQVVGRNGTYIVTFVRDERRLDVVTSDPDAMAWALTASRFWMPPDETRRAASMLGSIIMAEDTEA
jgi:hypothetical protein